MIVKYSLSNATDERGQLTEVDLLENRGKYYGQRSILWSAEVGHMEDTL